MGNACEHTVSKSDVVDIKYKYGCCSAVNAGFFVNEQVANPCRTTNGVYVELSAEALQRVQVLLTEKKGEPVRVIMKVPCCGGGGCACPPCFNCPDKCEDPVDIRAIQYAEVWFANRSAESMCSGLVGHLVNHVCANIPLLLSIKCVPTVNVHPHEVNAIDPSIRFGFVMLPTHLRPVRTVLDLAKMPRPPVGQYSFAPPQLISAAPTSQAMQ